MSGYLTRHPNDYVPMRPSAWHHFNSKGYLIVTVFKFKTPCTKLRKHSLFANNDITDKYKFDVKTLILCEPYAHAIVLTG